MTTSIDTSDHHCRICGGRIRWSTIGSGTNRPTLTHTRTSDWIDNPHNVIVEPDLPTDLLKALGFQVGDQL